MVERELQGDAPSRELAALKEWRASAVAEGELASGAIKDVTLETIVARGRRDERIISSILPASHRVHTRAIVEVLLSAVQGASRATGAVPAPQRVTPSAAHQSGSRRSVHISGATSGAEPRPSAQAPEPTPQPPAPAHVDARRVAPQLDTQRTRPESAPEASVSAQTSQPVAAAERLNEVAAKFAPMDFTEPPGDPGPLTVRLTAVDVQLSWAAAPAGGNTVYRVVSTDGQAGYDPEFAELIDITDGLMVTDHRPFVSAVRYYQVWRNTGSDLHQAMASQPTLHAQAVAVIPVQQVDLREDGGRVIAQWVALPGTERVHIHRIPIERAARTPLSDSEHEILRDATNLTGFVDSSAVRGQRYLYRFFAEAKVEGVTRLSAPFAKTLTVTAVLDPVQDLAVSTQRTSSGWQFDLAWTGLPVGAVVIYRTQRGPAPGAETEVQGEDNLASAQLVPDCRLAHPANPNGDGRWVMTNVPAPEGWDRVYFTPVTLLDGRAVLGRTVSRALIPDIIDAMVVERGDYQLLKFSWPGSAAKVGVVYGARGASAIVPQPGPRYEEISQHRYRELGGMQLGRRLPGEGCSVHLVGISFVGADRAEGNPTVVDYPGLLRLRYEINQRSAVFRGLDRILLRLRAEREITNCPPFVLIHHPDRLPLHARDGHVLPVTLDVEGVTEPRWQFRPTALGPTLRDPAWKASVRGLSGYVRLFADLPPGPLRQVALLDPPVSSLMLRK